MEHNKMDKLFRDIINNDNSELKGEEIISKENIWNELDVPKRKRNFHFWKIAAAILLLLWGGTAWFFSNKINQENLNYSQLQKNYDEVKNSLNSIQLQLDQANTIAKIEKLEPTKSEENEKITFPTSTQKEVIEKIVFVHDTILIRQNISPQQLVQVVKDTVFIEVPVKAPFKMTELKNKKEQTPKNQSIPKTPSKIEFVFGKKPLKKPTKQNRLIIINENEVAKKTTKTNSSLIKIPIKN